MSLKARLITIICFVLVLPFIVSIWILIIPIWLIICLGKKILGNPMETYTEIIDDLPDLIHWW